MQPDGPAIGPSVNKSRQSGILARSQLAAPSRSRYGGARQGWRVFAVFALRRRPDESGLCRTNSEAFFENRSFSGGSGEGGPGTSFLSFTSVAVQNSKRIGIESRYTKFYRTQVRGRLTNLPVNIHRIRNCLQKPCLTDAGRQAWRLCKPKL